MSFANLRTQPVSVESRSGRNFSGDKTYAPPVVVQCHIQYVDELVTDQHGNEVRSSTIVYLYDVDAITYEDRLTTPDGSTRLAVKIRKSVSMAGRKTLVKVWLK